MNKKPLFEVIISFFRLTVTKVVFELFNEPKHNVLIPRLTVTKVVFEWTNNPAMKYCSSD